MANRKVLNLLVVDSNQLYAERLVSLLSSYYKEVNLGFLDDKKELVRLLRHDWDVLIFGQAYDMAFTDVVGLLQEQEIDLPLICLLNDEVKNTGRNQEGLPSVIDGTVIKALSVDDDAKVVMAICLQHDALQSRRELANLRYVLSESEQRANILIKNSKSAVAYIDQGIHIFANDPYLELFGFSSMEDIMGVPVIDLIAGNDNVKGFKQFLKRFEKGSRKQVEFEFESKKVDGSTFSAKLQLAAATLEGQPVTQIIIQNNNTNAAEIAKQLAVVERKDNLTGLENRLGFESHFNELYQRVLVGDCIASLLYIRIDNIGKINSSLGLQGIDATIKQVAYTLNEFFNDGYVSRFGDSMFAVLLEDMPEKKVLEKAEHIRGRIDDMLIEVGKRTVETTVSIGIVMMDRQSPEASVVIDRAIEAMNEAIIKTENNGNAVHLYDLSQHANNDDDTLAEYLVSSLTNNHFKLLYQPIYDVNTDLSDLYEVYLRLPLADGNEMTLEQFMLVAKNHDLLGKIDRWMLINACKQLSITRRENPNARLLISLSSVSLSDTQLPTVVSQLIKAIGGQSGALILQFNEQDVVDYLAVAKKQFMALSKIDCGLGICDFGATAKTIETVDFIQPNIARLAKGYVKDLGNPENLETITTLVTNAKEHNVDVLMPYIGDASMMSVSWSVGARYLQGDYLQMPTEDIAVVE